MFSSVLCYPIWQGAGHRHGYAAGAQILRRLAAAHHAVVDVPVLTDDFSPAVRGVKALETLQRHFELFNMLLDHTAAPLMLLGGDCVADYLPIAHNLARHGDQLALVWVDAHPDINTPASSPSGNFHGMLLRALMGEGPPEMVAFVKRKLTAKQLFYVGLRDPDPEEVRFLAEQGIFSLSVEDAERGNVQPLLSAIHKAGCNIVHLHVDSDVMSLDAYPQAAVPVAGGLSVDVLVRLLQAVRAHYPLAGAALTEYSLERGVSPADEALAARLLTDGFGFSRA